MLFKYLTNSAPFASGKGLAIAQNTLSKKLSKPVVEVEICPCDYECEYIETVFGDASTDFWKSDKNSFLFRKIEDTDTIVIKLYKDEALVATITDSTYGDYYDGFDSQPLYIGFIIHWKTVLSLLGTGLYQVKADLTVLGEFTEFESQKFRLYPYDPYKADKTVRIETYQTGNIIGSEFDYTDLLEAGWYQSYRIGGFFGERTPKFETDSYLNTDYEVKQIQDKIVNEFTLFTNLLPATIMNQLTQDNILANEFLITDYNFRNTEEYRRKSVYPVEISEVAYYVNNTRSRINVKFEDKQRNLIKTNY